MVIEEKLAPLAHKASASHLWNKSTPSHCKIIHYFISIDYRTNVSELEVREVLFVVPSPSAGTQTSIYTCAHVIGNSLPKRSIRNGSQWEDRTDYMHRHKSRPNKPTDQPCLRAPLSFYPLVCLPALVPPPTTLIPHFCHLWFITQTAQVVQSLNALPSMCLVPVSSDPPMSIRCSPIDLQCWVTPWPMGWGFPTCLCALHVPLCEWRWAFYPVT